MPEASGPGARPNLGGQVALVTGGGSGIGRALAEGLAGAGATVVVTGRRPEGLQTAAKACRQAGGEALARAADVTDPGSVAALVADVERDAGPVDLLVNSAGRIDASEVVPWDADEADWWSVVETNVRGPFLLARALLPSMVSRGRGRIVNLASGMGTRPVPEYSAYSVSKAALARLTDTLAAALEGTGVGVFDVSPGRVRTDMTASMPMFDDLPDDAWTPVERVVDVVLSLAAGEGDDLSGRFLHVSHEDVASLRAAVAGSADPDARRLRLRRHGPDDPLS